MLKPWAAIFRWSLFQLLTNTISKTINDYAYSIISEAMCPFDKLLYHQPLDEIRILLLHLNTSLYELLDSYRRAFHSGTTVIQEAETASSLELHVAAQNRAITAEYLGLTEGDYVALTGEDYLQNKYNSIEDDESSSPGEPAGPIKKRTWWEHWGYDKKAKALKEDTGPDVVRSEFLRRTGLKASDLVELLKTEYVNPFVPRGEGIAILENNEFGFVSFCKNLSGEINEEDPVVKYKALIDYMHSQQIESHSIGKTGKFTRGQIEEWVKLNSDVFSKVIVLDNPHKSEGWHSGHARLIHLDGGRPDPSELMRIQQFVRLRAKMGWTIEELDKTISVLSRLYKEPPSTPLMITADLLDQLVCVAKLLHMTGLGVTDLLTLWSMIDTRGENCLYSRLFLTHHHFIIDPLFKPDENGNYFTESGKLSAHRRVIMAALGLTEDGINAFMSAKLYSEDSLIDGDLSIKTLSFLYRHSLMARLLKITPAALCQVIGVFGDIFEDPSHTLEFLEQWRRMSDGGISFAQLNYVLKGIDDPLNPLGPEKLKILAAIKSILDGIDVINTMHPDLEDEEQDTLTKDALTAKLSLLYDEAQVKQTHEFLEGSPEWIEKRFPSWLNLTFSFINDEEGEILSSTDSSLMKKRWCFMKSLMPYLRQQLIEQLVIATMSREVGIPVDMAKMLLSDILHPEVEDEGVTALKAIADTKLRVKNEDITGFEGYLVSFSNNAYTFIHSSTTNPNLQIDDISVLFSNLESKSTDLVYLDGGRPHPFRATNDSDHSLQWKAHPSPIHPIPQVTLIPRHAEEKISPVFVQLAKVAMVIKNYNLSMDEVKYMTSYPEDSPILKDGILSFEGWRQLLSYLGLRNSLPNMPRRELIHLFRWAGNPEYDEPDPGEKSLSERISSLMAIKENTIQCLLTHFQLDERELFTNWENLTKLKKASDLAQKVSVDVDTLFTWAERPLNYGDFRKIAQEIQGSIRGRYTPKEWGKVVKPLRHRLRLNQQNALIGYLLNQEEIIKWKVVDADSLFEFFLIDVQMGACLEISRVKQAIFTVQLLIQRCLCGQEEKYGVPIRTLDRKGWEQMKSYRTWEGNRKNFVYPENWIEPSLRDDKSEIFQQFETGTYICLLRFNFTTANS